MFFTSPLKKPSPYRYLRKICRGGGEGKFRVTHMPKASLILNWDVTSSTKLLNNWFCKCQCVIFLIIFWLGNKFWLVERSEIFSGNELKEKVYHRKRYKALSHVPTQLKGYQPDKKEFYELNLTRARHEEWIKTSSLKKIVGEGTNVRHTFFDMQKCKNPIKNRILQKKPFFITNIGQKTYWRSFEPHIMD